MAEPGAGQRKPVEPGQTATTVRAAVDAFPSRPTLISSSLTSPPSAETKTPRRGHRSQADSTFHALPVEDAA